MKTAIGQDLAIHLTQRLGIFLVATLMTLSVGAHTYQWTNTMGGDWSVLANWSPNGIPGTNDIASITTAGIYTVTCSNNTAIWGLKLGAASGTQTLLYGSSITCTLSNSCAIQANGVMMATNAGLQGDLTIEAGGELQLIGPTYKYLYGFKLVNQGTVTWSGGALNFGGSGLATTIITNSGLWQITGDSSIGYGGGPTPIWVNSGTLRKSGGAATTVLAGIKFVNQSGGLVDVLAGTLTINGSDTNVLGGTFSVAGSCLLNFMGTWTDAGATTSGTGTNQFTSGTLLLRTNTIPGLRLTGGDVYVASTFQQAGAITNLNLDGAALRGTNSVSGNLTLNSGNLVDQLTIQPAGQLVFATAGAKLLYFCAIFNQGTVTWAGGSLNTGNTSISNGGLWQITGDFSLSHGGYSVPNWTNAGILRKTAGLGVVEINDVNFINQPGGLVDAQSGMVRFIGGILSQLGGTFNASAGCAIDLFNSGTWTDAGGVMTGAGTKQLNGATFNFRTNTIPGLKLAAGNVYITGTNTFQQAGAITNLVLDGASLLGTNYVGNGVLTLNSGSLVGWLMVQTNGLLVLATTTGKSLYSFSLMNQGTVQWSAGDLSIGTTVVSNGGLWQVASDNAMNFGGGITPVWTNSGTVRKTSGPGVSSMAGFEFYNQPSGLVQVDTGTLQLTSATTNTAGTLRLNGGKLLAAGTLAFSGGTFDGSGVVGPNALSGGLISPGLAGAGLMRFSSGLQLSSNATLTLDGTGFVPGTSYDQLSVTGAVAIGNCTLQVTGLPSVPTGTTLIIIDNDSTDAVTGIFNGLPENALVPVSSQLFRISYQGGTGNDVTLTRIATTNAQPQFGSILQQANGSIHLAGTGTAGLTYTVQAQSNLTAVNWTTLGTVAADPLGNLSFTDPAATNFPARFYRFVWP